MPTYEYVCKNCGHLFEIVQSMKDDPLRECPECGGELRKVFTAPAIAFKGSGFYATDHGKKSKAGASAGEKKPAGPDKGPDAGSDKPAEKSSETRSDKSSEKSSDKGSGSSSGASKGDAS